MLLPFPETAGPETKQFTIMSVPQTTQGVQVNCFRTLEDLVLGYQQPHKGLVIPLLYAVPPDTDTGDESSGGSAAGNEQNCEKVLNYRQLL